MSDVSESHDTSYVPSPSKLNSDFISSWLPQTPSPVKNSVSGSVQNSPSETAEVVSEGTQVVYKGENNNYFLKTNYVLPKRIFKEQVYLGECSVVQASDMNSASTESPYTESEFRNIKNMLMKYIPPVPDIRAWFIERVYKLHNSWKRLFWSPDEAHAFPQRFKKLVQLFLLDRNFESKNFEAMMLVFRHMSEQGIFFKKN